MIRLEENDWGRAIERLYPGSRLVTLMRNRAKLRLLLCVWVLKLGRVLLMVIVEIGLAVCCCSGVVVRLLTCWEFEKKSSQASHKSFVHPR